MEEERRKVSELSNESKLVLKGAEEKKNYTEYPSAAEARRVGDASVIGRNEQIDMRGLDCIERDRKINGRIPITLFYPRHSGRKIIVLFFHGGDRTKTIWISVGYSLAPENPYPKGIIDAEEAVNWLKTNKKQILRDCYGEKISTKSLKIGIAGDSGGGTLAARCTQYNMSLFDFQILLYPSLDLKMNYEADSMKKYGKNHLLTISVIKWFTDQYFHGMDLEKRKKAESDVRCSPAKYSGGKKLPKLLTIEAPCDPLFELHLDYFQKAKSWKRFIVPGAIHGFFHNEAIFPNSCELCFNMIHKFINDI
ncbi:hypothetical protein SNEBB_005879 [Seison nebaliae]|nr:hypothetical protein SNEBB_005879 [Seison nebaliae]